MGYDNSLTGYISLLDSLKADVQNSHGYANAKPEIKSSVDALFTNPEFADLRRTIRSTSAARMFQIKIPLNPTEENYAREMNILSQHCLKPDILAYKMSVLNMHLAKLINYHINILL